MLMLSERVYKWIFIISVSVMALTTLYKDEFPEPITYNINLLNPPIQTPTSRNPFNIDVNGERYSITPKFDYDLTGVLVSYHDADSMADITHHDLWKDFLNVRDLCVIWGPNVRSGVYKNIKFNSDTWTCWFSWNDKSTSKEFQFNALSNNHILTADHQITNVLLSAEKGDVIHFKGVLAEYKDDQTGFFRGTSITREDIGSKACETVYIDQFNIIQKANPFLRTIYKLAKWLALLSLIGFLIMFFKTPYKTKQ